MNIPISNKSLRDFLNCRYKSHLKLLGHSGWESGFESMCNRQMADYRKLAQTHLSRSLPASGVCHKPASLLNAIRGGYALLVDANTTVDDTTYHFDALLRITDAPETPKYTPVLYVPAEKITPHDKLLLAIFGSILGEVQGNVVQFGNIIHGVRLSRAKVQLHKLLPLARKTLRDIAEFRKNTDPPPLRLNNHCPICEFRDKCKSIALEKDDLSLIRGLRDKKIAELHAKGIFTVNQFSFTFRPRKQRKGMHDNIAKHNHALQARALRENNLYVAEKPDFPGRSTQAYLDVEGIPDKQFHYLIGLLVVAPGVRRFHSFWADTKDKEKQNWTEFLVVLNEIDDLDLFHYGTYEQKFLREMHRLYGGSADLLDRITSSSFNVLSAIHSHIYFPVLSNDLKSIASCLGFTWASSGASGLDSIVWRDEWERSKSASVKEELIQYNKDDCLALEAVTTFLRALCNERPVTDVVTFSKVVNTCDLKPELHRFQKQKFFFPDLAQINKCSYFDYQKNRVYLRSNKGRPKAPIKTRCLNKKRQRVNKVVIHSKPEICDRCGSHELKVSGSYKKDIVDLKIFPGGIRAWNERHKAKRYKCKHCGQVLYPEEYLSLGGENHLGRSQYGANLNVWCVYNKIALSQSLRQIVAGVQDVFGLLCHNTTVGNALQMAAQRYQSTYLDLIEKLRNSAVIHADETWVSLAASSRQRGYIWTFANMESAIYKFSLTREAVTPTEMLQDFNGVLVSDFYRAYDSLECAQQKCLVHLVRNMNDDIFKNPFDQELKTMVAAFGVLLRSIVETIDRYGLKKRHLNKHRNDVDRFYRKELELEFASDTAKRYQKRMRQYRESLFVFLERDGVPWNNNNAENAIKTFVVRRKNAGAFSEGRIDNYLILLSIFQTLRYRDASFFDFLRSGERDIERFCKTRR